MKNDLGREFRCGGLHSKYLRMKKFAFLERARMGSFPMLGCSY